MNKKSKILFVNPSGWQKENINLGLSYLSAALKNAGYTTLILDLNSHEMSDLALLDSAKSFSPTIVGISIKTATANEGGRIANLLAAEIKNAIFIAGGPHLTICADSYLKTFPFFHYGIMGEGEKSIVALVDAIEHKKSIESIDGLVHRKDNLIVINPWSPPDDLDTLPMPDIDAIDGFNWNGFRYPLITSRGCPFNCIYCCVNKLTGSRRWRARSVKNVIDELEHRVRTKGINAFEIWDDNFTLDINRAKGICRELIRRKLNLSWYCHNGIRADRIDRELAMLMKRSGCTSIAIGIESGDPEIFNSIKKGEPFSAIINAVNILKKARIKTTGYFIIGLPGDNLDRFIKTVRFQRSLKLNNHVFGMLTPYPKTDVWDMVQARGTMLCDITHTQHFHSDIVPISFEMPEFPRQDMVRAYYIARFFPLYEAAQELIDKGKAPIVVYLADEQIKAFLAGMIIACHPNTKHIIVVKEMEEKSALKSFLKLPIEINISFSKAMQDGLPKDSSIVVCCPNQLSRHIVFDNVSLIFIDPSVPLMIKVKKYIKFRFPFPEPMLGIMGLLSAVSLRNIYEILKSLLKTRHQRLVKLIKLIKTINIKHGLPKLAIFTPWYVYKYSRARKKLKMLKPEKKNIYPYNDYTAYM